MNLLGKVAKEFGEYVAGEDQRGAGSEMYAGGELALQGEGWQTMLCPST